MTGCVGIILLSENTIRCPNCGYAMQNTYVRMKNSNGKRTLKTTGTLRCMDCKIEKPSQETKIIV